MLPPIFDPTPGLSGRGRQDRDPAQGAIGTVPAGAKVVVAGRTMRGADVDRPEPAPISAPSGLRRPSPICPCRVTFLRRAWSSWTRDCDVVSGARRKV